MNRTLIIIFCLPLVITMLPAFSPQEPATEIHKVVFAPPQQTPVWDTLMLKNDASKILLVVPAGKRFVLTDLWTMEDDFLPGAASANDRVWLESVDGNGRHVVFDAKYDSLPSPMRWETGPVFGAGSQVVMLYRFADQDDTDLVRRVHFTGYLEDIGNSIVSR